MHDPVALPNRGVDVAEQAGAPEEFPEPGPVTGFRAVAALLDSMVDESGTVVTSV